jgi:2-keto-4-pentenoate hydratase/2-oxohepta-3-ene-1,7-dioic acid hydratase in catechol pathway
LKLGRIRKESPDGPVTRIVAVHPDEERVVDLATAHAIQSRRAGASDEGARRLAAAFFPASMSEAIAAGDAFLRAARDAAIEAGDDASLAFADVDWAAPLDPPVIRDSMTFPMHMKQVAAIVGPPNPQFFSTPGFFKGSTATVYGPEAEVPYPSTGTKLDYELEVGIVVGRPGRNLTPDQAQECIFGLTIFNDFSMRDIQGREMGMGMGPQKCKDFAYGIGPWITTIDETLPITEMSYSVSVNGERWAVGNPEGQFWSSAELLAYVSIADGLQPGDIIATGTVGNGSGTELGRHLEPGDVVELTAEGIGTLRNTLSATPEEYPWWPEPKPNPFEAEAAQSRG